MTSCKCFKIVLTGTFSLKTCLLSFPRYLLWQILTLLWSGWSWFFWFPIPPAFLARYLKTVPSAPTTIGIAVTVPHFLFQFPDNIQIFVLLSTLLYCYSIVHWSVVRVFVNESVDQGSISDRVIPKTKKLVLDAALLNTQHYQVRIKGKVEQSWEWSGALPYTSVW